MRRRREADVKTGDVIHFDSASRFRAWLDKNHARRSELWVGYWKKATGRPSVTWEESVDEALCFGWIDGIRKRVSDEAYTVRFTARRPGSIWSRRNIERCEALTALGRMTNPGLAAYERRTEETSGIYSFEQGAAPVLPPQYLERLRSDVAAWGDWKARPPGYRRQVAHWIMSAKREATRERRLTDLIADSSAGRKVKPLR
jgi:uncharacterized protein YdeI (YjbR/CyaY-like superfamily)